MAVKFPCAECNKNVGSNSILCIACGLWVHKRCSKLKKVSKKQMATFQCSKCLIKYKGEPPPFVYGIRYSFSA